LAEAADVVRVAWSSTNDPAGRGETGEVVWSSARQEGFMIFRGIAANDPSKTQYQLWIFDSARDERYPVDGGVFDVDASRGEVVIPITAKVRVSDPTLFAVTVEPPGGVVVSKRERIVVTAKVAS
jgi:anti-sigma-K factor RskA